MSRAENGMVEKTVGKSSIGFKIGDIVWAKLDGYPYWPGIVCNDPTSKEYIRISDGDKKKFSIHVRFCNDKCRRTWTPCVEYFFSEEELFEKHPNTVPLLKNTRNRIGVWHGAITEAYNWLKVPQRNRVKKFLMLYKINEPKEPRPSPRVKNLVALSGPKKGKQLKKRERKIMVNKATQVKMSPLLMENNYDDSNTRRKKNVNALKTRKIAENSMKINRKIKKKSAQDSFPKTRNQTKRSLKNPGTKAKKMK